MSHLPIWLVTSVPAGVCDIAAQEFNNIKKSDAAMGLDSSLTNHSQRNTSVSFAHKDHWFGYIMYKHGIQTNKNLHWGFDINDHEAVQWAEYGPEQHYDWHTDLFVLAGKPQDRKVTVVCLMNDPSEFEGGEFQVRLSADFTAPLTKGSMIAFPSMLYHRVVPVTKGFRYTATMWLTGPRMR